MRYLSAELLEASVALLDRDDDRVLLRSLDDLRGDGPAEDGNDGVVAFEIAHLDSDRALLVSRLINRGRRRGESTLSPDQLAEAVGFAELVDAEGDRVTLVDVTPVNRTRNFHNFSLETPEFFDDLYLRLRNRRAPRTRLIYPVRSPEGQVYWVLTRGR